jgi:hypothetical protein
MQGGLMTYIATPTATALINHRSIIATCSKSLSTLSWWSWTGWFCKNMFYSEKKTHRFERFHAGLFHARISGLGAAWIFSV